MKTLMIYVTSKDYGYTLCKVEQTSLKSLTELAYEVGFYDGIQLPVQALLAIVPCKPYISGS